MRTGERSMMWRAKAVEVAGPGAAGVDQRRRARAPGDRLRLHAEAGAAPVDVGVQVDQPRHHEVPVGGDHVARLAGLDRRLDRGDLAVLERDIARLRRGPLAGSITRPPRITRSYMALPPLGRFGVVGRAVWQTGHARTVESFRDLKRPD